jgi:SAM-dependent methyltransferase
MADRNRARELAERSLTQDDPIGWFEELYRLAERQPEVVPWADKRPNPHLVSWLEEHRISGRGRRALVVGCGYGDDAEWLTGKGFKVLAFDISPTAISVARRRFPDSSVDYQVVNVLDLPDDWLGYFDFVFEAYTLQVLRGGPRVIAARQIAATVKETLLVIARGRDENENKGQMPWPLTRSDLLEFHKYRPGLVESEFEDFLDGETPPVRRFRVEYRLTKSDASA